MQNVDRAIHEAITDWSDDDDFFTQWHRFINGPLAATIETDHQAAIDGLPRRRTPSIPARNS